MYNLIVYFTQANDDVYLHVNTVTDCSYTVQ